MDEIEESGINPQIALTLLPAIFMASVVPIYSFFLLKWKLDNYIAIVMNENTFSQATDIDYFMINVSGAVVTPEWIVNTYFQRNWVGVFY